MRKAVAAARVRDERRKDRPAGRPAERSGDRGNGLPAERPAGRGGEPPPAVEANLRVAGVELAKPGRERDENGGTKEERRGGEEHAQGPRLPVGEPGVGR